MAANFCKDALSKLEEWKNSLGRLKVLWGLIKYEPVPVFRYWSKNMFSYLKKRINGQLLQRLDALEEEVDSLRSRIEIDDDFFNNFQNERISEEYLHVFEVREPLISVCVGTYNRGKLLTERCLPSILGQTYKNIEVIVIGDGCTDDTERLVKKMDDERLFFLNLPERGKYPDNPRYRWMVAGTSTVNKALTLAKGDFITHVDDDDEHICNRIERLLEFSQKKKCDFVWHPFWSEMENGKWILESADFFKKGSVTTSSVFYHKWFTKIHWDINAYKLLEPGDWNRFRKMKYLGIRAFRYPEPLLKHYKERNQTSS